MIHPKNLDITLEHFNILSEILNTQNQWIPDLNLTNQDRLNIRNNEEIDDFIIFKQ